MRSMTKRPDAPMSDAAIDLRIKAERIIRADRIEAGHGVAHLNFEAQYNGLMNAYLAALQRINRIFDHF